MEQNVLYKKTDIEGSVEETVLLTLKEKKYDATLTTVEMTIPDAMELSRLLADKLGEIPA